LSPCSFVGNVTFSNEHDPANVKVQNGEHDDGGSMSIRNVGTYLPNHAASRSRSQPFSQLIVLFDNYFVFRVASKFLVAYYKWDLTC